MGHLFIKKTRPYKKYYWSPKMLKCRGIKLFLKYDRNTAFYKLFCLNSSLYSTFFYLEISTKQCGKFYTGEVAVKGAKMAVISGWSCSKRFSGPGKLIYYMKLSLIFTEISPF
jgi:hypothetical protein